LEEGVAWITVKALGGSTGFNAYSPWADPSWH
jgi:hypothetical protein